MGKGELIAKVLGEAWGVDLLGSQWFRLECSIGSTKETIKLSVGYPDKTIQDYKLSTRPAFQNLNSFKLESFIASPFCSRCGK